MKTETTNKYSRDRAVCRAIQQRTIAQMSFWKSAAGWAPVNAANLLSKSALEWQASLAQSLKRWVACTSEGDLILAWTNLGALVEGQLKLFLSVYYYDYAKDIDAIKDRKKRLLDPDQCSIEPLRQFFVKRIWTRGTNWNPFVQRVQLKRNAIHAFRRRDIGTFDMWRRDIRIHLKFLMDMDGRLPYPLDPMDP